MKDGLTGPALCGADMPGRVDVLCTLPAGHPAFHDNGRWTWRREEVDSGLTPDRPAPCCDWCEEYAHHRLDDGLYRCGYCDSPCEAFAARPPASLEPRLPDRTGDVEAAWVAYGDAVLEMGIQAVAMGRPPTATFEALLRARAEVERVVGRAAEARAEAAERRVAELEATGCPRCGHPVRHENDHTGFTPCSRCGCMSTTPDAVRAWISDLPEEQPRD